jgi:sortase A
MPHILKDILKDGLSRRKTLLLWLERLLLAIGLLCLGLVAYTVIDSRWFAYRQGRLFDDALRARAAAAAAARAAEVGKGRGGAAPQAAAGGGRSASETDRLDTFRPGSGAAKSAAAPPPPAAEGSLLGRIEIPRVGVSSLVLEGVAGSTLHRGVGHIPGTPLPQLPGNVGLAGHRDTVFRGLKDIQKNDLITVETLEGTYRYAVDWARVVDPGDVAVLGVSNRPELTLVTCFPFYYVGSAPERFIVRARLLDGPAAARPEGAGEAVQAPHPAGEGNP